ncbi:metal ABC transporter substrate-binding protein [Actinomycetospora sp. OC33-EN08]|uniref:Metal ABC transporter substrate-binding protein n=1 Tax=Actinomycetospora aurantiaca TaxID=3129233 RepID=A0ABU8MKM1_9PSEU
MPNNDHVVWRNRRPGAGLVALAATLGLLLAGCGSPPEEDDGGRLTVLTTFTVIADMTREVAGGRVDVESVTRPGAEIHEYEPTPDDLVRGADADLILDNGLGLERWFDQFIERAETPAATLSDRTTPIPITSGSYTGAPNPHAWMSPLNGVVYVENIRDALTRLDPAGAAQYRANAERYTGELRRVNDELVATLSALPPNQRALVSCEGAFSYLTRDAGLREGYLWPVNSDAEGTPQQIAATVEFVRQNDVPAVFCESTVNDGAQRQVAADTGARLGPPLYVDSLSEADGPVPTYLELLRHDARTIGSTLTTAP